MFVVYKVTNQSMSDQQEVTLIASLRGSEDSEPTGGRWSGGGALEMLQQQQYPFQHSFKVNQCDNKRGSTVHWLQCTTVTKRVLQN